MSSPFRRRGILLRTGAMATVLVDRDAGVAHIGPGARWGEVPATSGDEHADLFWALRGGGGSFGVVTSMELALHPVAPVYAGTADYAVERATETLAATATGSPTRRTRSPRPSWSSSPSVT